ncbi:MAG: N-acetylneuraminate synthase [Elusimicrobia bacterium]|nr:N-acetylneuraminate synthase [Elusimicrobiota bacterium]
MSLFSERFIRLCDRAKSYRGWGLVRVVKAIKIGGRLIGPGYPCFIIAEAGVNHNGRLDLAFQLVDAAVEAKADVVKFQTFKAEHVASPKAPKADYQLQTTPAQESQLDMIKKLELPFEAFKNLQDYCRQKGILFLSSPFDDESVDFLAALGVAAFKVPSGEITNEPYLSRIGGLGKPVILSTGMCYLEEVARAVEVIGSAGNNNLVLLHCVSRYPADPGFVNLRAMKTMHEEFHVPVGYSDHTTGIDVALAAVALGACVIEKHLTLDHNDSGPDHSASLEPADFAAMVRGIRRVEAALGDGLKRPAAGEQEMAKIARKSLVARQVIPVGALMTDDLVGICRPGTGLPPGAKAQVLGRRSKTVIPEGSPLSWEMFQ